MHFPAIDDTIVAISTAWAAGAVGVIRLSGRDAFARAATLGAAPPRRFPSHADSDVAIADGLRLPATLFWFRAPRSYTGQDCVEIHTVGCLPLLRSLAGTLVERGARRALPGEFTARAYLNGRLPPSAVAGVLRLLHAGDAAAARAAARAIRGAADAELAALRERVLDLLARVEAGIDFVEEEDIRFISDDELRAACGEIRERLETLLRSRRRVAAATWRPHVALAGLPNAGKSTLFNALLGTQRAIVSPVVGATRDVLSAEVEIGGARVILQDCAGLSDSAGDIDVAARVAAEAAAQRADLVLWVHDATRPLAPDSPLLRTIARGPRLVVLTKCDLVRNAHTPSDLETPCVRVSAATGAGLDALHQAVAKQLAQIGGSGEVNIDYNLDRGLAAIERIVRSLVSGSASPELISIDLREVIAELSSKDDAPIPEQTLAKIFSQFCIGK